MDPDNSYREKAPVSMASRSADDENDSNPPGRSSSESAFLKTTGRCLKTGTWNVRTLYQPGNFENLIQEMQNMNLDILGIAEIHWTEEGQIIQENQKIKGMHGLGRRNERGERLIQFCQENKLIIANTWFQ